MIANLAKQCGQLAEQASRSQQIKDQQRLIDCCCDLIKECCGTGAEQSAKVMGQVAGDANLSQSLEDCETKCQEFLDKQQQQSGQPPRTGAGAHPLEVDPQAVMQVIQLVLYFVNWYRNRAHQQGE